MVEKPEYIALIYPGISGLPESEQREIVARYAPTDYFTIGKDGNHDDYAKMMRAPRVALVSHTGLLGEQRGGVEVRKDSMVATKVAIHNKLRCRYIVEASTGRNSNKSWPAMKKDGNEMCRRLAQGRSSAVNGRRGADPYEFTNEQLLRFALEMKKKYPPKKNKTDPTPDDRRLAKIAAYCKQQKKETPRRTWLKSKLPALMRERNLG